MINQENIENKWTGNGGKRPKVKKSTSGFISVWCVKLVIIHLWLIFCIMHIWLNTDMNQRLLHSGQEISGINMDLGPERQTLLMPAVTPVAENLKSSLLFPVFIVASPLIPIPES